MLPRFQVVVAEFASAPPGPGSPLCFDKLMHCGLRCWCPGDAKSGCKRASEITFPEIPENPVEDPGLTTARASECHAAGGDEFYTSQVSLDN